MQEAMSETITWHYAGLERPKKSGEYLVKMLYRDPLGEYIGEYTNVLNYSKKHDLFNAFDWDENPLFPLKVCAWAECPQGPKREVA